MSAAFQPVLQFNRRDPDATSSATRAPQAEATFPGFLQKFLTHPIEGLENFDKMFDALTNAKDAIKVHCVVAKKEK